ncbi:hypothetical protein BYT27DRAFT_7168667 [Phlegmacium glaucopus]|nr:hypothetical protein BYT27DRAFT_7168667 [Phlegmacium glaucopus]
MKLSLATVTFLALVASSSAQYFSAGWTPGQKQPEHQPPQESQVIASVTKPSPIPEPPVKATPFSLSNLLDINRVLTTGPSVALFNRFGINITERVEASRLENIWDIRVPLITDDNYNDLIVNETLTEQEEKDRVWIIVISVTSVKTDGVSKFLDNVFDSAFNESQIAGDLPHVKWGRIDYLNVTRITTKWVVWQAPYLVLLKDRGMTLRFYRPQKLRLDVAALREFLKVGGWEVTPPWSSIYGPGGSREHILDFFAVWLTKFYNITILIPRWILVFGSGTVASLVIGYLHRTPQGGPAVATQPQSEPTTAATKSTDHESAAPQAKRTGAKQRKHKT